jgi:GT2 family glycosyltransferase
MSRTSVVPERSHPTMKNGRPAKAATLPPTGPAQRGPRRPRLLRFEGSEPHKRNNPVKRNSLGGDRRASPGRRGHLRYCQAMAGDVDVSVVVPAYRADRTLERCLTSLLGQCTELRFEVVLVVSADRPEDLPELTRLARDPRLRVLAHGERLSAAAARNAGVGAATGDLIAFTDADVVAPPGWLDGLVAASAGGRLVVAGGVRNGTPWSLPGTVEYLVEFLDLHPDRPSATAWHGATCNLLVSRAVWRDLGPFPEDMDGGEDTLLTVQARAQGQFAFAGGCAVFHLNRTGVREVVRHQYGIGRFTAHLGRRGQYKLRPLVRHPALAPLAAAGRIVSTYARVVAWAPELIGRSIVGAPLVVAAFAAWGAGLFREGRRLDRRR